MARFDARQVQQQIANLYLQYPELRDDDELLKLDMLEGATDLHEFMTVVVNGISDANALSEGTNNRIDELKARKTRFEKRAEFLREMLLKIMQAAEIRKLELPVATIAQRAGQRKIVGEVDGDRLPDDLVRIERVPRYKQIGEALLAGRELPGLSLSNAAPGLTIRVR